MRSDNQTPQEAEPFKCSCGNEIFLQEGSYMVTEQVTLHPSNGIINLVSHDMTVNADGSEHFNEYKCVKCGAIYRINLVDGKESIILS